MRVILYPAALPADPAGVLAAERAERMWHEVRATFPARLLVVHLQVLAPLAISGHV